MVKNHFKGKRISMPIEKHNTAAWANIEKEIPESRVTIPSEGNIIDAKEWVEVNQK